MSHRGAELIPRHVIDDVNEMLRPLNPNAADSLLRYVADELTSMFRELSEERSADEGKARLVLSRKEERLFEKLNELLPGEQSLIEELFKVLRPVFEQHFENQRGRKYL